MSQKKAGQSANIFELIDQLCDDFRKEWKAGERPQIDHYLERVPDESQSNLFQKLLLIDLRYRERLGDRISPSDYLDSYPQFRRVIGDAFHQSASHDLEANAGSSQRISNDIADTVESASVNRIGEYELIRELGRGAFGIVYEAQHRSSGNRVALKTLPTREVELGTSPERLQRFRREFRSLAEINHPNLVGMQTLEVDGDTWFFTMDLIEGTDFLSYVRPGDALDEQRLRSALSQLVIGTSALHERQIVHRDLKPSNVLIQSDGTLIILDFGLVARMQRSSDATLSRSGMFAGTPRYAAPEQMFGERSEASDWYAIGTMAYESLTGKVPFAGSHMQVLRDKQERDPDPLANISKFPNDLADLVDRLLKREPIERPTQVEILECLRIEPEMRSHGSTSQMPGSSASAQDDEFDPVSFSGDDLELVGRRSQQEELETRRTELLERRSPLVVWIKGKSGEGKSALAEEFLRPLRRDNKYLVLSGRCYERESVPFKAIDCWIEGLAKFLDTKAEDWLQQVLPEDITGLSQIFPVLQRVEAIRKMPSIATGITTPDMLRHRAFGALRDLLAAVSRELHVIVFVDDLQWGDADSVAAFERIFAPGQPQCLMLLGSYRSEEDQTSPFLNQWRKRQFSVPESLTEVGPLNECQARDLIHRFVPEAANISEHELKQILDESGGSPYLLSQLIESFDQSTGQFHPVSLRDLIARRLSRLPESGRAVLEMLAVVGHDVPICHIEQLAGINEKPYALLTRMRNEKLVRVWGSGDAQQVDTFHDKIRETVVGDLITESRRTWHLSIAETYESLHGLNDKTLDDFSSPDPCNRSQVIEPIPSLFDLAEHFHAARDSRGFKYQLLAGEEALRLYSIQEATGYLEHAKEYLGDDATDSLRYRVLNGLATAYLRAGRVDEAIQHFQFAEGLAPTDLERARVLVDLAEAYVAHGETTRSIETGYQALSALGRRGPKSFLGRFARVSRNIPLLILDPLVPRRRRHESQDSEAALELQVIYLLFGQLLESDYFNALELGFQRSARGLRSSDPIQNAIGYSNAEMMFSGLGWPWMGNKCHDRRMRQPNIEMNAEMVAIADAFTGNALYFRARFEEALEAFQRASIAAERCGDHYSLISTLHFQRHSGFWSRSTSYELDAAIQVSKVATEIGESKAVCWGFYDQANAYARAGDLGQAAKRISQSRIAIQGHQWYQSEVILQSVLGFVLLQCSKHERAAEVLEDAWKTLVEKRFPAEYTVIALPLLIESLPGPDWLQQPSSARRRRLNRLSKRASIAFQMYPTLQALIARAQGRYAASIGKLSRSRRLFMRSLKCADRYGMPYHRARALLDLAVVKEEESRKNRAQAIELLKKMESVIPRAESWLLGDQYDEEVVAPEFDLDAWERENGPVSPRLEDE